MRTLHAQLTLDSCRAAAAMRRVDAQDNVPFPTAGLLLSARFRSSRYTAAATLPGSLAIARLTSNVTVPRGIIAHILCSELSRCQRQGMGIGQNDKLPYL